MEWTSTNEKYEMTKMNKIWNDLTWHSTKWTPPPPPSSAVRACVCTYERHFLFPRTLWSWNWPYACRSVCGNVVWTHLCMPYISVMYSMAAAPMVSLRHHHHGRRRRRCHCHFAPVVVAAPHADAAAAGRLVQRPWHRPHRRHPKQSLQRPRLHINKKWCPRANICSVAFQHFDHFHHSFLFNIKQFWRLYSLGFAFARWLVGSGFPVGFFVCVRSGYIVTVWHKFVGMVASNLFFPRIFFNFAGLAMYHCCCCCWCCAECWWMHRPRGRRQQRWCTGAALTAHLFMMNRWLCRLF